MGNICLNIEKCTYTKQTPSVLMVKYNDNLAYDTVKSNIAMAGYLDYVYTGGQGKLQVSWVIVSSAILDCNVEMQDIVDNSKIFIIYYEFLSIFLQSISDLQPIHHLVNYPII
jgi:hypothetical protein